MLANIPDCMSRARVWFHGLDLSVQAEGTGHDSNKERNKTAGKPDGQTLLALVAIQEQKIS
ncbi:MAG: hypothetical protein JWR80_943 [Bradyrhizobium sp.]|nr:hypothetical protein [Bradyrhizobium sp.]